MARREYPFSPKCAHEGCPERAHYYFTTRREYDEESRRVRERGWRCVRHSQPNEVLSAEEPVREVVLEIFDTDFGYPNQGRSRFWTELENVAEKKLGKGFLYGPGFKAFAKDFPVGTRLTVTARVDPPAGEESP